MLYQSTRTKNFISFTYRHGTDIDTQPRYLARGLPQSMEVHKAPQLPKASWPRVTSREAPHLTRGCGRPYDHREPHEVPHGRRSPHTKSSNTSCEAKRCLAQGHEAPHARPHGVPRTRPHGAPLARLH